MGNCIIVLVESRIHISWIDVSLPHFFYRALFFWLLHAALAVLFWYGLFRLPPSPVSLYKSLINSPPSAHPPISFFSYLDLFTTMADNVNFHFIQIHLKFVHSPFKVCLIFCACPASAAHEKKKRIKHKTTTQRMFTISGTQRTMEPCRTIFNFNCFNC